MGNRIKEMRTEKKMTQKDFAFSFNKYLKDTADPTDTFGQIKQISYATVSRWENGLSEPKTDVWEKLADFFDVSIGYIQGYSSLKNEKDINQKAIALSENLEKLKSGEQLPPKDLASLLMDSGKIMGYKSEKRYVEEINKANSLFLNYSSFSTINLKKELERDTSNLKKINTRNIEYLLYPLSCLYKVLLDSLETPKEQEVRQAIIDFCKDYWSEK
ncbi:helix-turn-helix domain-containing protein [Liquorilactobacillus satsumensis]|uniref:helix-turn-helix domain-containing protein n=1 Tax=Liquorilactobacillus satsumensis TaxID=259059 RepID=UPI0039E871EA